jgi:hypothetical protein
VGAIVLGESIGPGWSSDSAHHRQPGAVLLGRERLRMPHIGLWSERSVAEAGSRWEEPVSFGPRLTHHRLINPRS